MATSARKSVDERVVLGLLESLEQDAAKSQRRLAADMGIALGLVNAYLNRCIQKGLIKVAEAPARRYAPFRIRRLYRHGDRRADPESSRLYV